MNWFLMEVCPRSHPLDLALPMTGFADLREFGAPVPIGYSVIDSRQGDEKLFFPREAFFKAGKATLEKLLGDPAWGLGLNRDVRAFGSKFWDATDRLLEGVDFSTKTDSEMAKTYRTLCEFQRRSHVCGLVWIVLEFDHQLLTRYLLDHLSCVIREKALPFRATEVFSVLTTPTEDSYAKKEELSLLRIACRIKDVRLKKLFNTSDLRFLSERFAAMDPALSRELSAHAERFAWLPYMYEGPAWDREYFLSVLSGLLDEDPPALLEQAEKRHQRTKEQQEAFYAQLGLDEKHRILLRVAQDMGFGKAYRKDVLYHFFWRMEPYLREVAKRLGLTLKQVRRFMPWELPDALESRKFDPDELNRRFEHYALYTTLDGMETFSGKNAETFLTGFSFEKTDSSQDVRELKGDCACPGLVKGVVRLVNAPSDMAKMNEKDVLVAHATNPDVVTAMKKAAAIVTDMGGITCHAAIVSRELKIPCVIGTKVATSALKDGDLVEVDATHGVVRKLS